MKSTEILLKGPMVRGVLANLKTQTRRPVNRIAKIGPVTEFQRSDTRGYDWIMRDQRKLWNDLTHAELLARCPFGKPGDRLWVRETWRSVGWRPENGYLIEYRADNRKVWREAPSDVMSPDVCDHRYPDRWRPSILMPRWACRLELEITDIRVQRLHDISEEDARQEGLTSGETYKKERWWRGPPRKGTPRDPVGIGYHSAREAFSFWWDHIYGAGAWDRNDWVWALTFKRVHQ